MHESTLTDDRLQAHLTHRLPDEPLPAYNAFLLYVGNPTQSYTYVARQLGVSSRTVQRWAQRYEWSRRASEYREALAAYAERVRWAALPLLLNLSVRAFKELLESVETPPHVRLQAALEILRATGVSSASQRVDVQVQLNPLERVWAEVASEVSRHLADTRVEHPAADAMEDAAV